MSTRQRYPFRNALQSVREAANAPVDIAGLVVFRVAFGLLMVWEWWRYTQNDWIRRYYVQPDFYFNYFGFEWVKPWSTDGMLLHFAALAVLGLAIAAGLFYRLSTLLFFLCFSYVMLLDKSNYLNHFYLISLISGLLVFIPAHRAYSLDARWSKNTCDYVPAWTVWLLRFQIAIPYVYGGIAKFNWDWLGGEPMRTWLAPQTDFPILGPYFNQEWMILGLSYAGLIFDLAVVPMLLWGRTRKLGFLLAVIFHLMNARLFSIGIFPWMMIAATTLFLPTDWPRCDRRKSERSRAQPATSASLPAWLRKFGVAALLIYVAVQLVVPLRHWLYPGDASWTAEGDRFAWRMKLHEKKGFVRFEVRSQQGGEVWQVDPRNYLAPRQYKEMCRCPDMVRQFAGYLAQDFQDRGYPKVGVYADAWMSLNGRPYHRIVDPAVDLSEERGGILPASWILPLNDIGPTVADGQTVKLLSGTLSSVTGK